MTDFESRNERRQRRREEWKDKWESRMDRYNDQGHRNSHVWTGLFLLVIGGFGLARSYGADIPAWMFSWQMLIIAIGLFIGFRKGFDNPGWFVPVLIGTVSLLNKYFWDGSMRKHMWPLIVIIIGVFFILRPRRRRWRGVNPKDGTTDSTNTGATASAEQTGIPTDAKIPFDKETFSADDYIDTTSIFGGTKKVILSKNFKGGDMVNIFGGSEIDLTKADIQDGTAVLEVTAIFGGATLVVPSHWAVKSEAVTIFGGVGDKRSISGFAESSGKNLVIRGTVLFGGIEIKSY